MVFPRSLTKKCWSHLKILGSRWETRRKIHAQDPQIIAAILQNLVLRNLCTPGCQRLKKHSTVKDTSNVLICCPPIPTQLFKTARVRWTHQAQRCEWVVLVHTSVCLSFCCFSLCEIRARCCLLLTKTFYCNTTSDFAPRVRDFVVVKSVLKVASTGQGSSEVFSYVIQKTWRRMIILTDITKLRNNLHIHGMISTAAVKWLRTIMVGFEQLWCVIRSLKEIAAQSKNCPLSSYYDWAKKYKNYIRQ
jgi:hypothetical protein